jgi:hypothetical protein
MSLPIGERRKLRRMERAIASTDPRLEGLYAMFTRLNGLDKMPRRERIRAGVIRPKPRVRRDAPLSRADWPQGWLQELELSGAAHGLPAMGYRQLAVHALEVRLHRVDGYVKLVRDLRGAQQLRHALQHFLLPLG